MITISFTGQELHALGRKIPATCIVRNELNGWRHANQVIRTSGGTIPHGLPYMPRPFPPGLWEITRVLDCERETEFWPVFLGTNAWQALPVWDLSDGLYKHATGKTFAARGYGIHHARWCNKQGIMVKSNTTIGCINVLDPADAQWLGGEVHDSIGMRQRVFIDVPQWDKWST